MKICYSSPEVDAGKSPHVAVLEVDVRNSPHAFEGFHEKKADEAVGEREEAPLSWFLAL